MAHQQEYPSKMADAPTKVDAEAQTELTSAVIDSMAALAMKSETDFGVDSSTKGVLEVESRMDICVKDELTGEDRSLAFEEFSKCFKIKTASIFDLDRATIERIFHHLHIVDATCLGVTCNALYKIHFELHGVVPLSIMSRGNSPYSCLGESLKSWFGDDWKLEENKHWRGLIFIGVGFEQADEEPYKHPELNFASQSGVPFIKLEPQRRREALPFVPSGCY